MLHACPFCASTNVSVGYVTEMARAVVCGDCSAVGPTVKFSAGAAIKLWNLRAKEKISVPTYISEELPTVRIRKQHKEV